MAWTDERIQLLTQYWDEGRSASQIAELLGEGLTRNAVIGKAHRLGLSSRPSPLKAADGKNGDAKPAARAAKAAPREEKPARPAKAAETPAEAPALAAAPVPAAAPAMARPAKAPVARPPVEAEPQPRMAPPRLAPVSAKGAKGGKVTLLDLNDRICRWPIGHPDEPGFHFCGKPVNPGFPYCSDHCLVAYQAQMPRRDRPTGPPRPFGPNLPRPR